MNYVYAAVAMSICVWVFMWQDAGGWDLRCNDGERYCSKKAQPYPFNRRFCGWDRTALQVLSLVSLVALGALMGDWKKAILLGTLPGAWFLATHKTTVDAPCMLLALGAALVFPINPWIAVFMSCLAGFIHERGPVFAALYAWHPLLLVGLVAVGWWRRPARPDNDQLVGRGLLHAIKAHKPYVDWIDMRVHAHSFRGVWLAMAYYGCSSKALMTVAVAAGSRLVGTDACRFMFWAAPIAIREMPDVPIWAVALHVATFRRAI